MNYYQNCRNQKKKINSTAATRKQEREFNHHWSAGAVLSLTLMGMAEMKFVIGIFSVLECAGKKIPSSFPTDLF